MNLEQIKYIVEVAKRKSISAAAQSLFVTPSAISQSIIHLEKELGLKLFDRTRQGVTITPEGTDIVRSAFEIYEKLEHIQEEALAYKSKVRRQLKIAAVAGAMPLLIRTITEFKKNDPKLRIEVVEMSTTQITDAVKNSEIDLGVISIRSAQPNKREIVGDLKYRLLTTAAIVAILPITSQHAAKNIITAEELRKESIILYNDDYLKWFVEDFSAAYGPLQIIITTHNVEAIHSFIAESLGISIGLSFVPQQSIRNNGRSVSILIEEYKHERIEIGWVYPGKKPLTAMAKTFMARCEALRFVQD